MSRPGIGGARRRRAVASAVAFLALFDVVFAAFKHPILRIGPIHRAIPHTAVVGSRYLLLASGVALFAAVWGLVHGKRQAWQIAVAATSISLVAHPVKRVDIVGVVVTAAVAGLLLSSRSLFPARSDPARARQGLVWLVVGELAVFVYGFAGIYFLDRRFVEPTDFAESVANAARLLFVLPATTIEPASRHGSWFIDSVRAMALLVLGISAWHLLQPVIHRATGGQLEQRRIRDLLESHATNSIAFFHLLPDKSYYFSDDGRAFIGYKVVAGVAVALGEPVGPPDACVEVARSFAEYCDLNGWAFCYHQVTTPGADLLRATGLSALKIGEEAIIPVQEFALAGKSFKHVRNAVNRLERDGYVVEELPRPIDEPTMNELEEVSDRWLADGGHRERTFTLGAFDRSYLRSTPIFIVRAPAGRIEAFVNLVPSFRSVDGNFDMMRRLPDSAEGVMDYLLVHLIGHFRDRGLRGLNLGFAPLANIEGTGVVARALNLLYAYGSRAFNFQGLRTYKDKWRPIWEQRFLVYRSDMQLPRIALAVVRAGEREGAMPWSLHRR